MPIKKLLVLSTDDVSPIFGKMMALKPNPELILNFSYLIAGTGGNSSLNYSRMSVMASHEPGGTSIKNVLHW